MRLAILVLCFAFFPHANAKKLQCSKEQQCRIKGLKKCCSLGFICDKKKRKCVKRIEQSMEEMAKQYEKVSKARKSHQYKVKNASNVRSKPIEGTEPRIKFRSPTAPILGNLALTQELHQKDPLKGLPPGNYVRCRDNSVVTLKDKEKANTDKCQGHNGVMEFKTIHAVSN